MINSNKSMTAQPELEILKEIQTINDAKNLDEKIDLLMVSLYKGDKEFYKVLDQDLSIKTSKAIREIYQKDSPNHAQTKDFLIKIKEEITKFKVLRLTIAIDPTEKLIAQASGWIKDNLGENVLLDIEKDRTLMGGAIITFEGKYKDYSVKTALEKELEEKKEEILQMIK